MPTILCGNDNVVRVITTVTPQTVPVLDQDGAPVLDKNGDPVTQTVDVTTRVREPVDGKRVTHFGINLDWATAQEIPADKLDALLAEYFTTITSSTGLWAAMSDARSPAWVTGDWPELVQRLAGFYGCGTDVLEGYLTDGGDLT